MAKEKKASAAPTNLKVTRDGNKFTFSWDRGKTAGNHAYNTIKCKYRNKVNGDWKGWSTAADLTGKSSWTFSVNLSTFFPSNGNKLDGVQAFISVCEKDTTKTNFTATTASCTYDVQNPKAPSLSVTEGASSTTYHFSVSGTGSKEQTAYSRVAYNTGYATSDVDPKTWTGWGTESVNTATSGDLTQNKGADHVSGTGAIKSMIRVKSQGPQGETAYTYSSFVYSYPYAAVNVRGTATNQSTGCNITAYWDTKEDNLHPVRENKVQYFIGTPANTALACPANANWQDGTDYKSKRSGAAQSASFYIDSRPDAEQCLWIRVWQKNTLNLDKPGNAVLVRSNVVPVAPSLDNDGVSYNAQNNALSLHITNNSTLPSTTVTTTVSQLSKGRYIKIATLTGTTPSTTLMLDNSTCRLQMVTSFGGNQSATTTEYFEPTVICSNPTRYKPYGVKATPSSSVGTAQVTWTPLMKQVTSSEITVATSPTEWSQPTPDFVATVTVQGSGTSGAVSGLSYGTLYYFRVTSTNEAGESGYSDDYGSCTLSAGSVTPNLTLTEDANHNVVCKWNWGIWSASQRIELSWSDQYQAGDSNADTEGTATIERNGRGGESSYTITGLERGETWYVWARYGADAAWTNKCRQQITLRVTPVAPTIADVYRSPKDTDAAGKTTVIIGWYDQWADSDTNTVSWSDDKYAWDSNTEPSSKEITSFRHGSISKLYISDLDLGKKWYFRVTASYDRWSADSSIAALDLRTKPETPVISLSSNELYRYGHIDASWNYSNEDLSAQGSAKLMIYNGNTLVTTVGVGEETAVALYAEELGLQADTDYTIKMRTYSATGIASDESEAVTVHVTGRPEIAITSTSLEDVTIGEGADAYTVLGLTALPLEIETSGSEHGGLVTVYIERSKSVFLAKPDETTEHGYEGELIALKNADPDGTVEFSMEDLRCPFEDMSDYRIVATLTNEYGKSEPAKLEFTCVWDHQAVVPDGTLTLDQGEYIAEITPVEPEEAEEGDTVDIYRLSADRPELIVHEAEWGTTYVDPYPALGDRAGYRIVYVTAEGDYTTSDDTLAWLDLEPDTPLKGDKVIIDFDSKRVELEFNMSVSHSWEKDFTETKYLGGAVQGDWNPAYSRTGSVGTVLVDPENDDMIDMMRRLADWIGICHVRTPDGSSFAADVQVSESSSYQTVGRVREYNVDITRVDTEGFDGMTLAEYEGENE